MPLYKRFGGRTWARTKDPLIKSQLLYQLSYASMTGMSKAPWKSATASGGRALANRGGDANPFLPPGALRRYQRTTFWFCRSIDIRIPMQISTVICADPPKLISGKGTPTTGARPITIAMLIDT